MKPIFKDFKIDKDNLYLNETFDKILTKKYLSYHEDIYNFCVNVEKNKPNNKGLAKHIYDEIEVYEKIPKYKQKYLELKNSMKK